MTAYPVGISPDATSVGGLKPGQRQKEREGREAEVGLALSLSGRTRIGKDEGQQRTSASACPRESKSRTTPAGPEAGATRDRPLDPRIRQLLRSTSSCQHHHINHHHHPAQPRVPLPCFINSKPSFFSLQHLNKAPLLPLRHSAGIDHAHNDLHTPALPHRGHCP